MSDGPTLIQSVQRALRIMEVVAEHDGRARAKEVARATGLPLATTYHLLRTCTDWMSVGRSLMSRSLAGVMTPWRGSAGASR